MVLGKVNAHVCRGKGKLDLEMEQMEGSSNVAEAFEIHEGYLCNVRMTIIYAQTPQKARESLTKSYGKRVTQKVYPISRIGNREGYLDEKHGWLTWRRPEDQPPGRRIPNDRPYPCRRSKNCGNWKCRGCNQNLHFCTCPKCQQGQMESECPRNAVTKEDLERGPGKRN